MEKKTKPRFSIKNFLFQTILLRLAVLVGKILPRKQGLKLAAFIGNILGGHKSSMMSKSIRANQWVIHNGSLSDEELSKKPKIVFRSAAKCMFDYFYFLSRPKELDKIVDFSPEGEMACERIRNNQPCVCVCPHISNFDLMGYALARQDLEMQVLSYPDPNASYKMQNKIREDVGIIVTPMSLSAFRLAKNRLREGKSVLTGLDRPLDRHEMVKHPPTFFGHEANLPAGYIRLAIDANAPVIVIAATSQPGGRYRLEGSLPIWMETGKEIEDEVTHNTNRVLKEAEVIIKNYSEQWAMFYPVWPQFLGK
jgi:lauroyl/myristoyl acyltransferase